MNPEKRILQQTGDEAPSIFSEESSSENISTDIRSTALQSTSQNPAQYYQGQPSSLILNSSNSSVTNSEMKRSAVKELIERYFYQLQRGCGNPKCINTNCASSGKVIPMTPNEIAAKAIQLFSQDAKLCDNYSQPPKVPRTYNESPSSSRTVSLITTPSCQQDTEMHTISDSCTSNSSSGTSSTVTSGSSSSSNSSISSSSNTTNTNVSSCGTESIPLLAVHAKRQDPLRLQQTNADKDAVANVSKAAVLPDISYLDEQLLDELLDEAEKFNKYERLLYAISEVFSNVEKLSKSFCRPTIAIAKMSTSATATKFHELLGKSPIDLKKEDLRALEGENDKDEDSTCVSDQQEDLIESTEEDVATTLSEIDFKAQNSDTTVDLESLRRLKRKLFALKDPAVSDALNSNIIALAEFIKYQRNIDWEKVLHCFVICFDMATNASNSFADLEYLERSLPKVCQAARVLPVQTQASLARIWGTHCKDQLQSLVECCQQLITLQVILDEDNVQENEDVTAITKVLKIAFYASLIAGKNESLKLIGYNTANQDLNNTTSSACVSDIEDDDIFAYTQVFKSHYPKFAEDKLEKELNVCSIDCRLPLVPFEDFYNEALSEAIQMDRDYLSYKNLSIDPSGENSHFSFMLYSFILTPATKVIALYYDSRIRMYSERNSTLLSLFNSLGDSNDLNARPDLKLKVRRENLIDDALIGLELVAMSNPKDLKKQLVVEFVGEQGIDEGGVSKEFFQLIVEEIFNPDFGMFMHQEDTNTVWFNTTSFENEAQFTLIGIIIGLAIYNNIILAVNFPMVVYRKLMGSQGTFYDLKDWNPTLYRSLKSMVDYEESDIDEVFMQTFKISYTNIFGEVVDYELKPGGADVVVEQHNKQEFIDLYSDYLLNKSIERQFKAFKKGFEMVTDESPLKLLFRPEEIELLVCGSRKFDFGELEKSTEYEDYTKDSQIIKDFWTIAHSMSEESKRKLLEFTTGSDRVPVGGLSRLKLLITRNGPDSDRLPTSHTCFNVLLLPEYGSKEKLEERLLKAINNSKGFGML